MRRFLNELLLDQVIRKMKMFEDNKTSFTLTKDPKSQNTMRHINVIYHHIGQSVDDEELGVK